MLSIFVDFFSFRFLMHNNKEHFFKIEIFCNIINIFTVLLINLMHHRVRKALLMYI